MQKLCSRVAELLRKHPILWLPYIAADLLAICLWRLRGLAEKGIFHWFTTSHSVLGGDIALPRHDSATLARVSITYAPIGFATIIAVVSLFITALWATNDIVDSIEREQRPDAREILSKLAAQWRRILLFALRFLITVGVFNSVVANAPDALLFIALALLAAEFSRENGGEEGSKILELLPLLMPLHFGKGGEPPQVEGVPESVDQVSCCHTVAAMRPHQE
jgi:uncharacterized membrane protein